MGQAMPKRAKSKKQKTRFKDDDSKLNADMNGWSDVARQDPWGPSHDESGWQPAGTGNTEWGATPTQEAAWTTWGHSDSKDAGGGTWGNDASPGHWGAKPGKGGRGENDTPRKGLGHGNGRKGWGEDEEDDEEDAEEDEGEDEDSGWGGDSPHWTTTIRDSGGFRSHWTKWGRGEDTPPPKIPSAIKPPHSTPQPSARPQSAQKHYQHHAETLNRLSSTPHQRSPSHKSRPTSTRSQPKPHAPTSPQTRWPSTRASSSSNGLSYADDDPPPLVQHYGLPPQDDYFTPKSPYTPVSPSRTLAAAMGLPSATHFASPHGKDPQAHRFISSDGAALSSAYKALYSKTRRAQDRLLWAYNPDNDERVKSALWWIHIMSEGIGGLGLQRFLETHKRGALFVNVDYSAPESPREPAFDWVTIDQLKDTLDKILQESVALYDPTKQVIVFIFLLSKSGNSMAIWRRKIPVPGVLRAAYKDPVAEIMAELQPNYPVYVEELPQKDPPKEQPRDTRSPSRRVLTKRTKSAGTVATIPPIDPTMENAPLVAPKKKRKWWKPWSKKKR